VSPQPLPRRRCQPMAYFKAFNGPPAILREGRRRRRRADTASSGAGDALPPRPPSYRQTLFVDLHPDLRHAFRVTLADFDPDHIVRMESVRTPLESERASGEGGCICVGRPGTSSQAALVEVKEFDEDHTPLASRDADVELSGRQGRDGPALRSDDLHVDGDELDAPAKRWRRLLGGDRRRESAECQHDRRTRLHVFAWRLAQDPNS
jgi:hypothetical protein